MSAGRKLVIVESPAKARTIAGYLGDGFDVEASVGHIRDLPQPSELPAEMKKGPFGKFAVDVDNGFEPYYVVDSDKKKKVTELKRLLKEADELYLATDEDREGEAIAWHLLQELKPKVPVKRMVFHEITREAITRALENTRELDDRLVDAQETRRILDRLYGYEVSPVLWRKVRQGLSAGRVQSVATRMVVERERERMAFRAADYWDLTATFAVADADEPTFGARLVQLGERRVATGRDFGDDGVLKGGAATRPVHLDEAAAHAWASALDGAGYAVRSLETKPYTRRPAAPFTTSTLQQEASRKLRMASRQTMRTAQSLYENGYITYMRTDSPVLSTQAIDAARRQAAELYGADHLPDKPRVYASKSKGAQEAHEAIRPAGDNFRTPAQVARELSGDQFRLYELIWKRTVASQMADARGSTASVRIAATVPAPADGTATDAVFAASGTVITFRGFLAAYEEGRDVERYSSDAEPAEGDAKDGKDARLPRMAEGDAVTGSDLTADGHRTSPPPRYTEASLVKALEERGIGRPSTYAATISVIQDRGYVTSRGQALVPTWLAFAVTRLLEENFDRLVDYDFTAGMEEDLDAIAAGQKDRVDWLTRFYFGARPGGEPRRDRRPRGQLDRDRRRHHPARRPVRPVHRGDRRRARPGRHPAARVGAGRPGPRRADGREGPRAAGDAARGRPGARHRPGHRHHDRGEERPVRPLRHRAAARARARPGPVGGGEEEGAGRRPQAAHGVAAQVDVPADGDAGRRAPAAQPAARGRHRPGVRRGDHRAERPVRALPEEGHRLAHAAVGGGDLHHDAGGGAGDLRAAQARPWRHRDPAAARAGRGPDLGQADRGEGRPVRRVRDRRRDEPHAAARRHPGVDHPRAGGRAAGREACPGAEEEAGAQGGGAPREGGGEEVVATARPARGVGPTSVPPLACVTSA
jgi:DNA topoisomerase I